MRVAAISAFVLCTGCIYGGDRVISLTNSHGASLALISFSGAKATLELKNVNAAPLAYDHWMSQGSEPVAHCRDEDGRVRICALRIYLTPGDEPYVHEAYLRPGASVKFQAAPGRNEQVGIHVWRSGQGEYLWLDGWTPNTLLEQTPER